MIERSYTEIRQDETGIYRTRNCGCLTGSEFHAKSVRRRDITTAMSVDIDTRIGNILLDVILARSTHVNMRYQPSWHFYYCNTCTTFNKTNECQNRRTATWPESLAVAIYDFRVILFRGTLYFLSSFVFCAFVNPLCT
jgi:hypothetical protein